MVKLAVIIKRNIFPVLLVVFSIVIFLNNYTPGTWLIGWDNLNPEFNFRINLERTFFSAWQGFQGLGLPSAMAHASDLPRQLILSVFSIFLPETFLRYLWQFLMLILGPLGMFFLTRKVFFDTEGDSTNAVSFLSGLFYLLNLATLQIFFAPQSMFTTQYGFLPWLFMFMVLYLKNGKNKNLLIFSLLVFLSSTQAFTPTLALSFFLLVGVTCLFRLIKAKFSRNSIVRVIVLVLVLLGMSAYWLLPFVYFLLSGAGFISEASINLFSSDESLLLNQKFAGLEDIAFLRGFWFGNTDFNVAREVFDYMFDPWLIHQESFLVHSVGWLLAGIVLVGLIYSIIRRKEHSLLLLILAFLSFFFLRNNNPPFGFIFMFLQKYVPLFEEALRFPFTKFSIFASFCYSILFGYGVLLLVDLFKTKEVVSRWSRTIVFSTFSVLLVFWMLPAFRGNFISENLRVVIPGEYFELFDWFEQQDPNSRILSTPMSVYWGWPYHNWGYRGSGFIWYGIKQPILARSFDVWSVKNEGAYWEFSQAIYSKDIDLLENLMRKYATKWILVDESIFIPGDPNSEKQLFNEDLMEMLEVSPNFRLAFTSDFIYVYEFTEPISFVATSKEPISINSSYDWTRSDPIYSRFGLYYSSPEKPSSVIAPFEDLSSRSSYVAIEISEEEVSLTTTFDDQASSLHIPDYHTLADPIPAELFLVNSNGTYDLVLESGTPQVFVDGRLLEMPSKTQILLQGINVAEGDVVSFGAHIFEVGAFSGLKTPIGKFYYTFAEEYSVMLHKFTRGSSVDVSSQMINSALSFCAPASGGSYSLSKGEEGITLSSEGNVACVAKELDLRHFDNQGLVRVSFDYAADKTHPKYCLYNTKGKDCENFADKYIKSARTGSVIDYVQLPEVPNLVWHFYAEPTVGEATVTYNNANIEFGSQVHSTLYNPLKDLEVTGGVDVNANATLKVVFPIISDNSSFVFVENFETPFDFKFNNACLYERKEPPVVLEGSVVLSTEIESSCVYQEMSNLSNRFGYVVAFDNQRITGKDQEACLLTLDNGRCDTPYKVDSSIEHIFIQPPKAGDSDGLAFLLNNDTFGVLAAENKLDNLKVLPIPYNFLHSIFGSDSLTYETTAKPVPDTRDPSLFKYGPYEIKDKFLVLYQRYDPGWLALCGGKSCNAEHVEVNNWANGWLFEDSQSEREVILVYWPQYLQFVGYSFLLGMPIILLTLLLKEEDPLS
jgi:hypothetical protein